MLFLNYLKKIPLLTLFVYFMYFIHLFISCSTIHFSEEINQNVQYYIHLFYVIESVSIYFFKYVFAIKVII